MVILRWSFGVRRLRNEALPELPGRNPGEAEGAPLMLGSADADESGRRNRIWGQFQ